MIPTIHKSKLPKSLSYPVGAEVISESLADAPHADECELHFRIVERASEFNRLVREGLPYRVFEAEYTPAPKPGLSAPNSLVDKGWYRARWWLTVYPVKAQLRHTAKTLLMEQGLPEVAAWLRSSKQAGWVSRRHILNLVFDPTAGTLATNQADGV